MPPVLVILSGLSGTGKTTIARAFAKASGAVYLRIDSIEQALREGGRRVEDEGYRIAHAIAGDNLRLGRTVIADSVNPWPITRDSWQRVATDAGVAFLNVEIVCSDRAEHHRRVESRTADISGHVLPTWLDVVGRDYRPWDRDRLVIDTATLDLDASVRRIVDAIINS